MSGIRRCCNGIVIATTTIAAATMLAAAAAAEPLTLTDWTGSSNAVEIGNSGTAVAIVGDPATASLNMSVAQTQSPNAVDQLRLGAMTRTDPPDLAVTPKAPGKENSDAAGRILAQLYWPPDAWMPQLLLYSAPNSDE